MDGGVHPAVEPSCMLPRYKIEARQTRGVAARYVVPTTIRTAMQGKVPYAVAELPWRLLIVAVHDGLHSPQLLAMWGPIWKAPRDNCARKGELDIMVHLQCSIYGALIWVWHSESEHGVCYNSCTSYRQCRGEPDSPQGAPDACLRG